MEQQHQLSSPKRRKRLQYCPHCNRKVSKSTWYRHYSMFYNQSTDSWDKTTDFSFSDDSDCDSYPFSAAMMDTSVNFSEPELEIDESDPNFEALQSYEMEKSCESDVEVWDSTDEEDIAEGPETLNQDNAPGMKVIKFIIVFLLTWQAVFRVANVSMGVMFKFIRILLLKLSEVTGSQTIRGLYELFPDTLPKAQALQCINNDNFKKYVVCQKCHTTYEQSDCIVGRQVSKCSFVRFPRHPQQRMRTPCGEMLFKSVKTSLGKNIYTPLKVFCYKSVISSIESLLQQPGMLDTLNQWRGRTIPNGVMCDVYDSAVWKSFLSKDGQDFLASRYCLGLLINVDWFQPYKHLTYSVGAIYLSILNFPRRMRNRQENIMLVGIIPGPTEPHLHLNSYLEPLVQELVKLQRGIKMKTSEGDQLVQALLLCCACDIPASRKLGGFLGHSAAKGCSRCLKVFPTENFGDKKDYSGFDRQQWPKRTVEEHRRVGMSWKHCNTLGGRHRLEQEYGVRFTELLRLSYFDTVRFTVVDPMHNILLGTPKHIFGIWKTYKLLKEEDFDKLQSSVNKFITPSDVGRIPHKIASNFSGFTADQWKNWTLIYSPILLKPILPSDHYECWCLLVDACRLLCSRAISQESITRIDALLVRFCQRFEELYGASSCTPNLHLHCHLKECLIDFGPAGSFWAFPFERFNGILGSVPTNHQAIELQLMRKFCTKQQAVQALNTSCDNILQDVFQPFLKSKGSLKHEDIPELPLLLPLSVTTITTHFESCKLIPPVKQACLKSDEHSLIECILKQCFGDSYIRTLLIHNYSRAMYFGGNLYGSINTVHSSSAMILAKHPSDGHSIPAIVQKFVKVTVFLNPADDAEEAATADIFLAAINWLGEHPERNWFKQPIEVWSKFLPCLLPHAFIPVSYIKCRCAYIEETIKFNRILQETVTVVIPINAFYGL